MYRRQLIALLCTLVIAPACAGKHLVTVPCSRGPVNPIEAGPLQDDLLGCRITAKHGRVLWPVVWGEEGLAWGLGPLKVAMSERDAEIASWQAFLAQWDARQQMTVTDRLAESAQGKAK
jgi:hypothetical protein